MSNSLDLLPNSLEARRALLGKRLRGAAAAPRQSPLSFAQQRLWFLDQLEPNSPLYNIATLAMLSGELQVAALQQALDAVVARHESLRTRFTCGHDAPAQIIEPQVTVKLRFVDLSRPAGRPAETPAHAARRIIHDEANRPFDLGSHPLLRATLLRLEPNEHQLLLVIHHIVADEWSLKIFFDELASFYTGFVRREPVRLRELPVQYADYAVWQREWLQGDALNKQLQYWRNQLSGTLPVTELPADRPRPPAPDFRGGNIARPLSQELTEALHQFARRQDATLFMVLLAAFKTLVFRYTQQPDIIVGSPIAGRNRVETEGLIGFFVNTLMLRTSLADNPTFEELVRRVRETTLGAYAHQDLPFEKLVEELRPERSLGHMPFARQMFLLQHRVEPRVLPGLRLQLQDVESDLAKFDLTCLVHETNRGLVVQAEYNCGLFDAATMTRLLAHFETLLRGIVAAPQHRLSELPLLTEAERHQLLVEWNDTATEYPRDQTVHQLFEAQAHRAPAATACVFGGHAMSYGDLNAHANQLAHHLRQAGIGPGVPVAICINRSADLLVALLATLKAGAPYVPLDPAYPKPRLEFMLDDTQAPVLLTQQCLLSRMPRERAEVICLDADWELIARESREDPAPRAGPESLAYLMYTSGSTGQPKGVAVPHRAIVRLVLNTNYIELGPGDRIAQVSNISFDAATFEIWGALLNGGQLVGIARDVALSPQDFARELREQGITAMFLTAALFNQLAGQVPGAFETLRTVIAGGEALDPGWVRAVLRERPPRRLVNGYGPTENTTFTCCGLIPELPQAASNVPIGRPIANTQVFILDPFLNPVPIGVPGELYTGGDGLAHGYWKRPELSAERFIANPFAANGSSPVLYKTGDSARYLPDGNIEFLGRLDQQVKIRGYRIELGEIETVLGRHPAIRECVVTARADGLGIKRLIAYVVSRDQSGPTASELRNFLNDKLPSFMVPAAFVQLSALPLTTNGKVDRKALPMPDHARPELERKYVAPRDDVERRLTQIWENLLGVQPVGVQDKFFDLGGHSLLAVRIVAQIQQTFGRKLRLATIFHASTIEQLAAILREEIKESSVAAATSLVEIQAEGSRPPLGLVHGAGGGMFWGYVNLSRHLGAEQPVYGFKSRGLDGREEFAHIEDMAAQYVADLRRAQPRGPYYLGGYCFGGIVAYEMARQLTAQGGEVAFLALFNCAPHNSSYTRIPWTPRWTLRLLRNLCYWAGYFQHLSANQRREFFRWKLSLIRRRLARLRARFSGSLAHVEAVDLVDLSAYTEEQRRVWEAHIRALLEYRPRPFSGPVHLFRSPGHPLWCSFAPDYGWRELAQGGVTITIIPGAHETILEEPCVNVLAAELSTALARAYEGKTFAPNSCVKLANCATTPLEASRPSAHPEQSDAATSGPATPDSHASARLVQPSSGLDGVSLDFSNHETYLDHFVRQVERTPDGIAVRFLREQLTYAQLNTRANQLAHHLQGLGVGPEVLVGVCLERSLNMLVALLAVWKAGGAYLPLDPEYPPDRLAYMLADSRAPLLLTQTELLSALPAPRTRVVCLDNAQQQEQLRRGSSANPAAAVTLNNLAYVIYTSGSTGAPKGVEISHRSLLNHNLAIAREYLLRPADRVLQFTPLSFDISVEEIFPSWLQGSTVIIRPEDVISSTPRFLEFIAREQISVLNLPTAYWHELVEFLQKAGGALPERVRLVVIGGEKASEAAYKTWRQHVNSSVTLINAYGPTEATVTTSLYMARPDDDALPIGQPIANTQVVLLDERLNPVTPGDAGELYIGGAGLARGYLNRPELTAQRFIINPLAGQTGSERLYRTGDLARVRADGNLEFLGRLDEQVKIRGYRIELGEVEAVLRSHPGIRDVAVVAREDARGGKRLVAYFVPRVSPSPGVTELLELFKEKLPDYMTPSAFVALKAMPLTPAGKVDRAALPARGEARPALEQDFVAPRTPLEEKLAEIWSQVLGVTPVGAHDHFLELGGHSLLAIQVLSRIRDWLAIEVVLRDFFAHPTLASLGEYLVQLKPELPPEMTRVPGVQLPLSSNQQRIWLLDHFVPEVAAYNRTIGVKLSGELNVRALEAALSSLSLRHEALRATFPAEGGQPVQCISEPADIVLPLSDLSGVAVDEREREAMATAVLEAGLSFISFRPMLRPSLLRLGQSEHWLLLGLHEIAADARSARLLLSELAILYEAFASRQPDPLPPLPVSYTQMATRSETSGPQPELVEYWKQQLQGAPPLLPLPADHPRPEHWSAEGARHAVALPQSLVQALEQLGRQHGCDLFSTVLTAFFTLLHRYTGSTDIVVGAPVGNCLPPECENLVGNFENLVALRGNAAADPPFTELLDRVGSLVAGARAHGGIAFADLLEKLQPERHPAYAPLFQVLFVLEDEPLPERHAAGVTFSPFEIDNHTVKFDLALRLVRTPAGLSGWFEYCTALFERPRMERLATHLTMLLEGVASDPGRRLSVLPLLPAHETRQVLLEWNKTEKPYPADKTLTDLFLEQVARRPAAEAVVGAMERCTYAQLHARASQIAESLRALGVTNETLVGICLERSPDMVAAILGVLLAGAAYVPLDPTYPRERLAFMLADANVAVLLTQEKLCQSLPKTGVQLLRLETLARQSAARPGPALSPEPAPRRARPSALAYVIYTSGSTGKPKGVALEHRSAVAFVHWARDVFNAEELSGVLASTSICFDLSIFELFVPLSWGGRVILAENALALASLPAAGEVTLINTVPSAMRELLRVKAVPDSVQVVNLAGEALNPALVDRIYHETRARKVYDLYGPTEATTYSTFALRQPDMPATIGRPLSNQQVYILDRRLQPMPIGVAGELFIGGDGLARGYLKRPELTAEKFIPHPFKSSGRLYRTGDLARWNSDGSLEYLGRIDHQVKLRGFRIELGEIESVLKAHPSVREAAVVVREDQPGDQRLVAYVALHPEKPVTGAELRQSLEEKLPAYMLPSAFVLLENLPLTLNGKVDRKALPAPGDVRPAQRPGSRAPRTALEQQLARIWQEVLQLKQIGIDDNFFELGGHSLLAVKIVSRIRTALNVELPLFAVLTTPTIAGLAEELGAGRWTRDQSPVVPLTSVSRQGPHPLSFVQERLWFLEQLNPGSDAYHVQAALRFKGKLERGALERALEAVVGRHEALRTALRYSEDSLTQVIAPEVRCEIRFADLSAVAPEQREIQAQQWLVAEAQRPFDLAQSPLFRTALVRLAETEHIFLLVLHHAVADGWSLALFFQELEAFYAAACAGSPPPVLPELTVQSVDFAHWQRRWMQGERLEQELAYWRETLAGAPPTLDLPLDHEEPDEPAGRVARLAVPLDGPLAAAMGEFGQRESSTPFMLLMAALAITLQKWTRQNDLVIGTVVAGRNRRELENVIGCFMNFLPLRAKLSGSETGRQILARLRGTVLEGQTHQDCPFEKLVEVLNPERRLNQNPLYNVGLLLQNFPRELFHVPTLEAAAVPVPTQTALLDLRFEAEPAREGLSLACEYRTELFARPTIEQLLASFRQVLETLVTQPEATLDEIKVTPGLTAQAKTARARKPRPTVVISASFTAEPMAESLRYWLKQTGLAAAIEFAPYNQIFQQLLDPNSLLATNEPGLNVLCVRLEDWQRSGGAPNQAGAPTGHDSLDRNAGEFVLALKAAIARNPTPYLVCLCPPSSRATAAPEQAALLARSGQLLVAELNGLSGVYVLTPEALARWYPVPDYYDASGEALGHVPYTPLFFTALGTAVARKFQALQRPPYKVLVLDCDQTLWSGVCGEDGARGLRLDPPRQALQEFMRTQQAAGRLLCLCSKNNEADVLEVFAQRPEMPLRLEHFAAWRLNWQAKSENLKSLAQELQLGLESFIFLDDNPVECAEVEANCPEVLTLQLPDDPALIPQFLNHCWVFDHLKLTAEDRRRSEFYRDNQQREQLRQSAPSLADFLNGLDLSLRLEPMSASQCPRAAQLTQRTNQFNTTTRRLSEGEIQTLVATGSQALTVQVSDRFGDYGLVGFILWHVAGEALVVDSLLLSCRVLGRGVEHQMLAHLGGLARARHLEWVDVHFNPTPKNKPALEFLESVGAGFRQALNGGYLFRFPVAAAAETVFRPPEPVAGAGGFQPGTARSNESAADSGSLGAAANPRGAAAPAAKFVNCRAIALEAHDVARIHQQIEAQTARRAVQRTDFVAPRSDLERKLCELWQELLRVERVGIHDNFFALGGHSLLAVRLFSELEKITGRKFPLVTLFQAPTIEQLAGVLHRGQAVSSRSLLVPIQPHGSKPPLFLVHGAGGDVLWGYANLAAHLPPDQPIYGLKSRGQAGLEEIMSLQEMASCYLQAVRAFQAQGPYYLGGYCFGGNVAYEMARQLEEQGQKAALVALLDSSPANAGYETLRWWQPGFSYRFARNFYFWLQDFSALPSEERRRFAARKLRALVRKLERRLRGGRGTSAVDLEEVIDPGHFPEKELKLWQIHLQALLEHRDQSYAGRVTLLRTRGQPLFCSLTEDFCWGDLAQGGVAVHHLPGAHENIFMEPNVKYLAEALARSLAEAHAKEINGSA